MHMSKLAPNMATILSYEPLNINKAQMPPPQTRNTNGAAVATSD